MAIVSLLLYWRSLLVKTPTIFYYSYLLYLSYFTFKKLHSLGSHKFILISTIIVNRCWLSHTQLSKSEIRHFIYFLMAFIWEKCTIQMVISQVLIRKHINMKTAVVPPHQVIVSIITQCRVNFL